MAAQLSQQEEKDFLDFAVNMGRHHVEFEEGRRYINMLVNVLCNMLDVGLDSIRGPLFSNVVKMQGNRLVYLMSNQTYASQGQVKTHSHIFLFNKKILLLNLFSPPLVYYMNFTKKK